MRSTGGRVPDFDELAATISPDQLAKVIGATKSQGQNYHCPNTGGHSHGDQKPSLSISVKDGRTVACCHGCGLSGSPVQVAAEVLGLSEDEAGVKLASSTGLKPPATPLASGKGIVETYDYTDDEDNLLFQVVRFEPKDFRQRRKNDRGDWEWELGDTRRVLYHLPQLMEGAGLGKTIYVVEGEKDVEAMEAAGAVATCNPGGAGKWRDEYTFFFQDAKVVIVADKDEPGRKHAQQVAKALEGVAAEVEIVQAREGKDASDHLRKRHKLEEFVPFDGESPTVEPGGRPVFVLLSELREDPALLNPPEAIVARLGFRGRASLLAAREKTGKSTLLAQVAADVSSGRPFLGEPTTGGNVIWCGVEEAVGDAVRRFEELDADPNRIQLVTYAPQALITHLHELLLTWPSKLLVVDSLFEFARVTLGKAPDSGDASAWGDVVRPLIGLSREFDICLITSHHARRSDGGYRDSTEIGASFDAIFEMHPPKSGEDPCLRHIEGRGRWRIEPFDVVWREDRYELAKGAELSLDALLLIHIEQQPGLGLNQLVGLVRKKKQTVVATLNQLEKRGAIENRRTGRGSAYYPTSDQVRMEIVR